MYEQIEEQLKKQTEENKPAASAQPVVETPVETKVVTTEETPKVETPAENNTEVQTQENKSNEENLNPNEPKAWYEMDDAPAAEQKPEEPKVVATEEEDEDIKLLREYKKSGKSLKDFVKDLDVPDYAALDDAAIVEIGLKQLEGFDGDEYNNAVEEFNNMSIFQKRKLIAEYRTQLIAQNEDKLKRLTTQSTVANDQAKQTLTRFQTEVETLSKELTGKEMYGITVTDEMSSKIKNFLTKEINLNRKDGSIDAELLADFALWRLYGKDIVRTNVTKAKNSGRREVLEATTNPSDGRGPSNISTGMNGVNVGDAFSNYLNAKKR